VGLPVDTVISYRAPLADMRFVLRHLAGMDELAERSGRGEFSVETADAVLEEAGRFAAEVLAPLNQSGDREGARCEAGEVSTPAGFKDAYAKLVAGGWMAPECGPEWGGQGMPRALGAAVREMWAASNLAFSLALPLNEGAVHAISIAGNDAQKKRFLPKLVSGEWTGCMSLTEPQAGSDLSAIRTRAEPQPDGSYHVHGQKIFITYGEHDLAPNIVHLLLARLPGAPEGVKGISLFLLEKYPSMEGGMAGVRNDIRCVGIEHKMGIHGAPTCTMAYGENGGARAALLGEPNQGLATMFLMMNSARYATGLQGVAIAERAYQQALAYARVRVQGRVIGRSADGATIIGHADVRRMLMAMKARIEAMRALCFVVAAMHDVSASHPDEPERARAQRDIELLTPVVKAWCTEGGIEVASLGIQIHGGAGYIEETGAAQHLRDARITSIYEGTTGIQAADLVGRKVARDQGASLIDLIGRISACRQELAKTRGEDFALMARMLGEGIEAVRKAGLHVTANFAERPRQVLAGSVTFLELLGRVCGGWQMARAALAARRCLDQGEGTARFMRAKIITARFFADQVLSAAPGLAHAACEGSEAALTLEDDQF
jgi:acyl-CoA dehydrogenase